MAVRAPFAWINSSKAHNDKCHKSKRMPDFSQQWGLNMAVYLWLMLRWLCVSVCVCVWRPLWPVAVQMKCQPLAGSNATLSHSLTLVYCSSHSIITTSVRACVCVRLNASDPCHRGTADFLITVAFQHQSRHCGWRRPAQSIYWPVPGTLNQQNPNSATEQSPYTHTHAQAHTSPHDFYRNTDRLFW